jgi:DNA (cytosine-5)-methyltransferase 1
MYELALFAGAGGGILGGKLLGWKTVCAVEINEYARRVLLARQDDGCLEPFPIWDDVRTFDGRPWRGVVDIVTGGFPCQDISAAGKGAGIDGARSGLWGEMARIIREVGPHFVLVENSPMLTSRGLGRVVGDLAEMGYDARWGVLGAVHAGAPHKRERIWIVAHAQCSERRPQREARHGLARQDGLPQRQESTGGTGGGCEDVADANGSDGHGRGSSLQVGWIGSAGEAADDGHTGRVEWSPEPRVGRVAHGVAHRVDRLCCLGNGQVSAVVRLAWRLLAPKE